MNRLLKLHFRRFEFKYLLTPDQYHHLKSLMVHRLQPDPFANKQGFYISETRYLDTPQLTSYQQNKAGLKRRTKYRIRTYLNSTQNSPHVFWEIKRKYDMTVLKDRSPLTLKQSEKFLSTTQLISSTNQVIKKFIFAKNRYFLKPKVLIRYRREPFISLTPEFRITFDSQIQVAAIQHIQAQPTHFQSILPQLIIMEFKFTGSLPFWLGEIIKRHNLERQPFSKYVYGIEQIKSHLPWVTS